MVEYKYAYVEPKPGDVDSSSPPINWLGIHDIVAIAHTHGAYLPQYDNNHFSPQDKKCAETIELPMYVSTPSGLLRRYDPGIQRDIIISRDIPSDPKHP